MEAIATSPYYLPSALKLEALNSSPLSHSSVSTGHDAYSPQSNSDFNCQSPLFDVLTQEHDDADFSPSKTSEEESASDNESSGSADEELSDLLEAENEIANIMSKKQKQPIFI